MSDKKVDIKVEQGATLQPRGSHENGFDFFLRAIHQKTTSFSIPPKTENETCFQFGFRLGSGDDK